MFVRAFPRVLSHRIPSTACRLPARTVSAFKVSPRASLTRFSSTLRYTKDHEWISLEGNVGTIGISDFAQNALGDVVYVDLPEVGSKLAKQDTLVSVESVKTASDVFAPAGGEVLEVNEELRDEPQIINKSPLGDGWMVKMKFENPNDLDGLLDEASYTKHCEEEDSH